MNLVNRAGPDCVALETTLLVHGVPRADGMPLARRLGTVIAEESGGRARGAIIGLWRGRPTVGLSEEELQGLFDAGDVPKANMSNLGVLIHRQSHGATTVSTTMELAAAAGVTIMATGGLGGVHTGETLDVSADLVAFTRFPVAVVTSGVKSLLNVEATREVLETLGIPVVGFRTDRFPAFYIRESRARVDANFDDVGELARYIGRELARTGRGIVVANPVPEGAEIIERDWEQWLAEARRRAESGPPGEGREVTPRILSHLHDVSGGQTLATNIALAVANARLAAGLCRATLSGTRA